MIGCIVIKRNCFYLFSLIVPNEWQWDTKLKSVIIRSSLPQSFLPGTHSIHSRHTILTPKLKATPCLPPQSSAPFRHAEQPRPGRRARRPASRRGGRWYRRPWQHDNRHRVAAVGSARLDDARQQLRGEQNGDIGALWRGLPAATARTPRAHRVLPRPDE